MLKNKEITCMTCNARQHFYQGIYDTAIPAGPAREFGVLLLWDGILIAFITHCSVHCVATLSRGPGEL